MTGEDLKGHLDTLLLAAVRDQPLHGYAIVDALRRQSGGAFSLPEGTVYPALHRLERAGLLQSEWSSAGPRRRRVYALTREGHSVLVRRTEEWKRFSEGVNAVLEGNPCPSPA